MRKEPAIFPRDGATLAESSQMASSATDSLCSCISTALHPSHKEEWKPIHLHVTAVELRNAISTALILDIHILYILVTISSSFVPS